MSLTATANIFVNIFTLDIVIKEDRRGHSPGEGRAVRPDRRTARSSRTEAAGRASARRSLAARPRREKAVRRGPVGGRGTRFGERVPSSALLPGTTPDGKLFARGPPLSAGRHAGKGKGPRAPAGG